MKKKWKVSQKNLDLFFKFMYERHSIWVKRYRKEPPPWTCNSILRDNKFTNIYRELDKGTLFYVGYVFPESKEDGLWSIRNLLFYTVAYRLLNRKETFEKVGFVPYWDWKKKGAKWFDSLKNLMKRESIFTSAHRTCPTHKPGQKRLDVYRESLEYTVKNVDRLWEEILKAKSLEDVFDTLLQIPNVGAFISYEICCDLILVKAIPFTENDWANTGPGARKGVNLIYPKVKGTKNYLLAMRTLQKSQRKEFKRLGLKFPYLYKNIPLSLRSIEHSLCEFCKYERCTRGGRTRVKFRPSDGSNPHEYQYHLRFPRLREEV